MGRRNIVLRIKTSVKIKRKEVNEWLLTFPEVKDNWLDEVKAERTGSEETSKRYLEGIAQFLLYIKLSPSELVEKARQEQIEEMSSGLERKTWAERQALAYFNYLVEKKGWRRTTAQTAYGIARSFFRYNGIVFKGKTPKATVEKQIRLPTVEDLRKVWRAATLSEKVALGLHRSTGWRPEDVLSLTYGDIKDSLERNESRIYLEKVTQKEDVPAAVFLTEETTEIVKLCLDKRRQRGEKIADCARILDYEYDNLLHLIQDAGARVGVKLSPKYFRKWFRTKGTSVIDKEKIFKMAGWTLPGVGRNYQLPSKEDTLEEYRKIEHLLTFEPKEGTGKDAQIQSLINFAIAQGLPSERARELDRVFVERSMSPRDAAEMLKSEIRQTATQAGGLPFQHEAAKQLAQILIEALKEVKEELRGNV